MAKKTHKGSQTAARPANGENKTTSSVQTVRATSGKVPAGDIALVLGKDAEGLHILRRRSEEAPIEAGLLRPMREGKPISGEVVSLTQRPDLPMVFDVKSEFSTEDGSGDRSAAADGPAQVASDAYRKGWEAVWGPGRRDRSLN